MANQNSPYINPLIGSLKKPPQPQESRTPPAAPSQPRARSDAHARNQPSVRQHTPCTVRTPGFHSCTRDGSLRSSYPLVSGETEQFIHRAFSRQKVRCVKCGAKFRRPLLSDTCPKCHGRVILTVTEGSVRKYLDTSTACGSGSS